MLWGVAEPQDIPEQTSPTNCGRVPKARGHIQDRKSYKTAVLQHPPTPERFRRRFHRRYNGRFCDIPGYFLSAISVLIYQRVLLLQKPLSIGLSIWERGRGRRVSVLSVAVFEKKQNKSNKFALPTFLNSFYSFCLYFSNFIHYEKHYSTVADAAGNRKLSGNSHVAELRTIRPDQ